jgi:hypothetical protein
VTHRARLAAADQQRAPEVERPERSTGVANGGDLRVRGRVTIAQDRADSRADHAALPHDQGTERLLTALGVRAGEPNRLSQQRALVVGPLAHAVGYCRIGTAVIGRARSARPSPRSSLAFVCAPHRELVLKDGLVARDGQLRVKVLFIHGLQLPFSSRSHQATDTVPSALRLILPVSSSSYWNRAGPSKASVRPATSPR